MLLTITFPAQNRQVRDLARAKKRGFSYRSRISTVPPCTTEPKRNPVYGTESLIKPKKGLDNWLTLYYNKSGYISYNTETKAMAERRRRCQNRAQ